MELVTPYSGVWCVSTVGGDDEGRDVSLQKGSDRTMTGVASLR